MWQARLILSTLEPETNTAARLRSSIRSGDRSAADDILTRLMEKRFAPLAQLRSVADLAPKAGTVLPPHPQIRRGRIA